MTRNFAASRERIALGTLLLLLYPLLVALSSLWRDPSAKLQLPSTAASLLGFGALQLAFFAIPWLLFWGMARPRRHALWLSWPGTRKTLVLGLLYSLGLRVFAGVIMVFAVMVLAFALGWSEKEVRALTENAGARELVQGLARNRDPFYHFVSLFFISFIVAGLREELWRVGVLAGLLELLPARWSQDTRLAVAVGASSLIFGLGHLYQGALGVFATTVLGIGLSYILLRHSSVWPAVVAHGFFNATTFAMGIAMSRFPS